MFSSIKVFVFLVRKVGVGEIDKRVSTLVNLVPPFLLLFVLVSKFDIFYFSCHCLFSSFGKLLKWVSLFENNSEIGLFQGRILGQIVVSDSTRAQRLLSRDSIGRSLLVLREGSSLTISNFNFI